VREPFAHGYESLQQPESIVKVRVLPIDLCEKVKPLADREMREDASRQEVHGLPTSTGGEGERQSPPELKPARTR